MQAPSPQPFAVAINNSNRNPSYGANNQMRPLTVNEALQYTPLTTSASSVHDRIPLPEIGRASQSSRLTTPAERKSVQRAFTQQSFQDIQLKLEVLLDPSALAEIKFKAPVVPNQRSKTTNDGKLNIATLNLTPAARMVLDLTDIEYQYPSPSTPSPPTRSSPQQSRRTPTLPTPAVSVSPEKCSNSAISSAPPYKSGTQTPKSSPKNPSFFIEVPALQSSAWREDYVPISDSPKRRKLSGHGQDKVSSIHVRAQKEIAETVLLQCQNLLVEIFEAQDQLEPDTSLSSVPQSNSFFDSPTEDEGRGLRLSNDTHGKLQNLMKQVIDCKKFSDLSSEHIKRLQQLCEDSIDSAQTINLKITGEASEDDISQWCEKLRSASNGAAAAATIIWTMLGSPHNEEMISPEVIRWLPNVLVNLFENCLIPVIESRPDGRDSELFKSAIISRDELRNSLQHGRKLLDLVANLCVQVKGAEEAINATEFLAAKLIFVENAPTEKGSVLGTQTFEKVRKTGMGVLSKLFAKFPRERSAILDEILSSMDKLPSTSRSARQYSVINGKIQLISALIMQLVQTTASESPEDSNTNEPNIPRQRNLEGRSSDDEDDLVLTTPAQKSRHDDEGERLTQRLLRRVRLSYDNCVMSAREIVGYLVRKASTSTKTGDQPYRNLLDLFVEDLLEVLQQTEWPASELLLRILAAHMIELSRNDQTALAKNMALETLGKMGTTISTLRASLPIMVTALSREVSTPKSQHLLKLADDQSHGGIRNEDLISFEGPLRLVYQSLASVNQTNLQIRGARGFCLAQWAKTASITLKLDEAEDDVMVDGETYDLVEMLIDEMSGPVSQLADSKKASTAEGRLAYALAILNQGFGRSFARIVKTLSGSFTSEQAQVRSRSLKSVISILETDSSLLDRDLTLMDDIFRCVSDDSAMVRDSALALIAKIIVWKPALQEKGIKHILDCSADSKVGVQKKSIGHLKDIYLRDANLSLQAAIAETILRRTADDENTVSDLAGRTLTDIWVAPNLSLVSSKAESARDKVAINYLALVVVKTIARNPVELTPLAEDYFRLAIKDPKTSHPTIDLYTSMVQSLFDSVVSDSGPLSEGSNKEALLLTLTIFANANAHTIAPNQLTALRPYLGNLVREEDLQLFRPVVAIFRCVLPHLSATQRTLLQDIHGDLMKTIGKLQRRAELDEVFASLWTIHGVLETTDKLVTLTLSVLKGILSTKSPSLSDLASANAEQLPGLNQLLNRQRNYVRIAGAVGKHFDLESRLNYFRQNLPSWGKSKSLAQYMANLIVPLTNEAKHPLLRLTSLESLGCICQSWPGEFKDEHVRAAFMKTFQESDHQLNATNNIDLQGTALKAFGDMLGIREESKKASDDAKAEGEQQDLRRLGGNAKAGDHDAAVGLIAQNFLAPVLHSATARQDEKALLAARVIASINRQGLVHPKQTIAALVTLETSMYSSIAEVAVVSHRMMHDQHGSIYDREYLKAVEAAFNYQKDVIGDSAGAIRTPYRAKLWRCWEIIRSGSIKDVKKFLSHLVIRSNVEMARIEVAQVLPEQMLMTRFLVQNLAFFDYSRIDELLHAIHHLEAIFGKTGAEIAQAIDTALNINSTASLNQPDEGAIEVDGQLGETNAVIDPSATIHPASLKQLATAATMMTMIWEARSYLKRQYGINQDVRQAMNQIKQSKEVSKPPVRVQGITGDRFWNAVATLIRSLESKETMMARCYEFSALMTIDDEVKVAAEDDEEARIRYSASADGEESPVKKRVRKRQGSTSVAGTPNKKKRGWPSGFSKVRRASTSSRSSRDDPDADFDG